MGGGRANKAAPHSAEEEELAIWDRRECATVLRQSIIRPQKKRTSVVPL